MDRSPALVQNQERAHAHLERFRHSTVPHVISGQHVRSPTNFDNLLPTDNSVLSSVSRGGSDEIDAAARAATAAFQIWSKIAGGRRRELLHEIADQIEARAEEIAVIESVDTGQPIRYMSKAAIRGAENFRFFADRAVGAEDGQSLPTETHLNY